MADNLVDRMQTVASIMGQRVFNSVIHWLDKVMGGL
jgi:hypothetical protein